MTTTDNHSSLPSPSRLREVAETLARDAGSVALAGRRSNVNLDDATKSSKTDMVTRFDREAERSIVDWLRSHRPDDAIIGEEGSSVAGTSGLEWHIDPIDGTTNFVYDQPAWACSVGVRSPDGTVAGAVYAPALDEMFSASRGDGATMNGEPIRVSDETDLSLALVGTGFAFDAGTRSGQGQRIASLLSEVRDLRRLGAASLDLCFVACGRLDVYFEEHLNSWDMLAGELIAVEAGAASSDFTGGRPRPDEMLVSTPKVHTGMISLLQSNVRHSNVTE